MSDCEIVIYGEPVAKGRPKFMVKGKFVQAYTPAKTRKEEKRLRDELKRIYTDSLIECPLAIDLSFYFAIPKSYSKKAIREIIENKFVHIKKPDCDNLAKLVLDAMNGIVYKDDRQIYSLNVSKYYTQVEQNKPRVEIKINKLK